MDLSSGHWYFRVIDNLFSVFVHDSEQENLYKLNVHFYTIADYVAYLSSIQ